MALRLHKHYARDGSARSMTLLQQIMVFDFGADMEDGINRFETLLRQYDELQELCHELHYQVMRSIVMTRAPRFLKDHVCV